MNVDTSFKVIQSKSLLETNLDPMSEIDFWGFKTRKQQEDLDTKHKVITYYFGSFKNRPDELA